MEMTALVWVLTYAIHSTVLICAVWVLTKLLRGMSLGTAEVLWKTALIGGIVTATLQMSIGATPPWGHFALPAELDTEPVARVTSPVPTHSPRTTQTVERHVVRHDSGELTITTVREPRAVTVVATPATIIETRALPPSPWPWVMLGVVGLGALFALVRLGLGVRRLMAKLRGRRDVIEDPVLDAFLELCQKAELTEKRRVRLTASTHLRSPIALWKREIVLPERAIERLSPAQQRSMLGHELAHIVRRDPRWATVAALVEAVFFFQPLNFVARRKIQENAEFQCDDWAARHAGTGVHLAKCLAEVAGWLDSDGISSPISVAMADEGSPVVRRITRLLAPRARNLGDEHSGRWFAMHMGATMGLLGLVAWLAPGITRAAVDLEPSSADSIASAQPSLGLMVAATHDPSRAIVIRDTTDRHGRTRSEVRIESEAEVLRIQVQRKRQAEPAQVLIVPDMFELEARDRDTRDRDTLVEILGEFSSPLFPGWQGFESLRGCGHIEIGVGDDVVAMLEAHVGVGEGCRSRESQRARRELERAQRHRARAVERAERKLGRAHARLRREQRDLRSAEHVVRTINRMRAHADADAEQNQAEDPVQGSALYAL